MFNLKPNEYEIKEYKESRNKEITLNEMFGRYFFKHAFLTKYYNPNMVSFTAPLFENWDVELSTPDGRKYFEIKCRTKTYDTMMMQVDKFISLKTDDKSSYYVNITEDTNKLYIWDLKTMDYSNIEYQNKFCPKVSCTNNQKYVSKDCLMLPTSAAKEYSFDFSIYDLKQKFKKGLIQANTSPL